MEKKLTASSCMSLITPAANGCAFAHISMCACGLVPLTECTMAFQNIISCLLIVGFDVLSLIFIFLFYLFFNLIQFGQKLLSHFKSFMSPFFCAALIHKLTLSKRPHSQMSCSLALVLIAMVKRICGMSSWEKKKTSIHESINQ